MNIDELYMIEDSEEFYKALEEAGLNDEEEIRIQDKRFRYLYEKYKPSDEHFEYAKEYVKSKRKGIR